MKKLKIWSLLRVVEWIVFVGTVLFIIALISPRFSAGYGLSSYVIISGSMEPSLHRGSISLVRKVDSGFLNLGDIIAFRSPEDSKDIIIHRIIAVDGNMIKTKGDNNNTEDKWTLNEQSVLGKIVSSIPYLGYVSLYMRTLPGFLLVIGFPAAILIFFQIRKIREGIDEEIQKRTLDNVRKSREDKISSLI